MVSFRLVSRCCCTCMTRRVRLARAGATSDVQVGSIPYSLTQSMASEPKDIALAVRIKDSGKDGQDRDGDDDLASSSASEEWQDMFEELGMEVVDETAQPEDDDERRELQSCSWRA